MSNFSKTHDKQRQEQRDSQHKQQGSLTQQDDALRSPDAKNQGGSRQQEQSSERRKADEASQQGDIYRSGLLEKKDQPDITP